MELHQLQCFIAVLEEGGFKRATARLGITQPALSYQIKRLEEELGVQVFHRGKGGIGPTEAGRALLAHAQEVISAVREAHRAVRELSGGASGEIRIGTIKCIGTYFLPRVLWEIRSRHPMVRPRLVYRNSDELLASLVASELDVALVNDPPPDPRLAQELILEERISLVSSQGHAFHGRPTVDVSELKDAAFVALSQRTSTGALIQRYIDQLGLSIVPAFSADDVETVKMMVEEGMGVAFLPDMVTSDADTALWRSAVEPPLTIRLSVVTRREAPSSLAVEALLAEVRRLAGGRAKAPARRTAGPA